MSDGERCRIVFAGSGGQGGITAAIILAEAAVIHEGLNAVQSQSYGAAARGGVTRSDLIISNSAINFPKVLQPNILVCLTQESFNRFYDIPRPGGLLLIDSDLVEPQTQVEARLYRLPMQQTVQSELGTSVPLNICMLGALLTLRPVVAMSSVRKVLKHRFRDNVLETNKKALELGAALARDVEAPLESAG